MNLTDLDSTIEIDAKLCGSSHSRRIAYSVMDFHHSLYINKKDIILGQIRACELLYKYTIDSLDRNVLRKEILDLKLILDLIE
jgi:hypothetical protein